MYNTDLPNREDLPTNAQLLRSTIIAFLIATVLLITIILPAEYGIDPTRIGRVLGLTQMGEIKTQLAEENAREEEGAPVAVSPTTPIAPSPQTATEETAEPPAPPPVDSSASAEPSQEVAAPLWTDEVSLTLAPGEAAEIILVMVSGAVADYEWTVSAGHLNSDLHGDGAGRRSISYRKGRAEKGDNGTLTAAFDGSHGWFWRNRSEVAVTMTLRVRGSYSEVKRVI